MVDRLRDIRLRLERAKSNFNRFNAEHAKYLSGPPPPYRAGAQSGGRDKLLIVAHEVAPLPPEWTLLVADIVTDCRFVLDYLAYQLVIRHTGQDPPPNAEHIEFPIFRLEVSDPKGAAGFFEFGKSGQTTQRSGLAKIINMGADVQRFIWDIQPYKTPGTTGRAEDNGLWILHDLCNTYKHRLLSPAALLSRDVQVSLLIEAGSITGIEAIPRDVPGPLSQGVELAEFRLIGSAPGTEIKVETQPTAFVGLEPGTALERNGVHEFLGTIVEYVGWITDELSRIGNLTAP
jgi:hypothetical protein